MKFVTNLIGEFINRWKYGFPIGAGFRMSQRTHGIDVVCKENFRGTISTELLGRKGLVIYADSCMVEVGDEGALNQAIALYAAHFRKIGYNVIVQGKGANK